MERNQREMLKKLMDDLRGITYIKPQDLPNIDLYMDQVTTFMDQHLESTKRYSEDKLLTKTMINNYTKNDLLPSPVKKKYSKEHLLILIFIYHFKNILTTLLIVSSIMNIQAQNNLSDCKIVVGNQHVDILRMGEGVRLDFVDFGAIQHHICKFCFFANDFE